MAKRMTGAGTELGARLEEKDRTQMNQAQLVRRMLPGRGTLTTNDGENALRGSEAVRTDPHSDE